MNVSRLNQLFENYIDSFERINNKENDETYKWEIAQYFQDHFNLQADGFSDMLYDLWKASGNLVDNQYQLPFWALVDYSRQEPDTVREMFAALLVDDEGDLELRQRKISAFIAATEELRAKYKPDSWRYVNDQRSVMTYLFLIDPVHNYLYKATQAHEFADCAEFYDDWGSGGNFKLAVYYRMCDELVSIMKTNEALLTTHESRFACNRDLYPDPELHVLCFDMIYSTQVYGLYNGIAYSHPNSREKRLYKERTEKACQLQAAYITAAEEYERLRQVKEYLNSVIIVGSTVVHKNWGAGIVEATDGSQIQVAFSGVGSKKFVLLSALAGKFIIPSGEGIETFIAENTALMRDESSIPVKLRNAEAALEPYREYI